MEKAAFSKKSKKGNQQEQTQPANKLCESSVKTPSPNLKNEIE
jgi:hypothetical protein